MAYEDGDNSVTLDNISKTPKIPWIAKFLANQGLAPQMEGPPAPPQAQDVQPQPDFTIGAPPQPQQAPANPMQDITQSMTQGQGAPQMAPETKGHKLLKILLGAAIGAGEGAGQPSFGGGFQQAQQMGMQRALLPWEYAQKQAQLQDTLAQTRQRNAAANMTQVTVNGMTYTVPQDKLATILGAQIGAKGRENAATIGAKAKLDAIGLQTQIQQGKVSRLVPTIDPDTNQPAYEAFNPFNQSMGIIKGSLVPGLMAKTSDTIQYETDADGNLHALPKRTVTRPQLPGAAPQGQSTPTYPATGAPTGDQPKVNAPRSQPNAPQPNAQPRANAPAPGARPQGGGIVPGFKGKSSADMGVAYDPQTNTRLWTTRQEAGDKGYQDFAPGGRNAARAMENDRQLNVRLGDVEQKISEYNSTFSKDLSENDSYYINRSLADMEKAATDYGLTGHVGLAPALNIVMQGQKADDINQLSPEGKKRLFAYVNAREAMNGYSRVLSGSGQTNETSLQLNLDVLPKPNVNGDAAKEAFSQFRQNLDTVGQGIPRLKSVKAPSEYRKVYEFPKNAPQQQQKESYPFQRLMGR